MAHPGVGVPVHGYTHASTGLPGLDRIIDELRLGDNIVWQVDDVRDYRAMVLPYVAQARAEGRHLVYVRFGQHEPLLDDLDGVSVREVDPSTGFESFAYAVHLMLAGEPRASFYVFDCLSDLLALWHSDLAVMNFFKVTCPFLFDRDAVAYFALLRNEHASATIAGIRETTQLLLDLQVVGPDTYVHPLKVWGRHSPTMFFPHLLRGEEALSITSSAASAQLFATRPRATVRPDHWQLLLDQAWSALSADEETRRRTTGLLLAMLVGSSGQMAGLCRRYLELPDLLSVAAREIGTGFIGGKSVGMLVARAILAKQARPEVVARLEPHDSYYLGSDLFYTYIVANGGWRLWTRHKTPEGYLPAGAELAGLLREGRFPPTVQEQFIHLLEHFGQSPIIVRSSSLLEDNYGNAFAGKYDSVFCANQGSPEERYRAFEDAVRQVYASAMGAEALAYRQSRGLVDRDEQMAILVQRVSGDRHGDVFCPHAAGVGNSANLYVWDPDIDGDAGMLRLVVGLGTRAVDRSVRDYARIVALDKPTRTRHHDDADASRYAQRRADVLSLTDNAVVSIEAAALSRLEGAGDWRVLFGPDRHARARLAELGRRAEVEPVLVDFAGLLSGTDFPAVMRDVLATLSGAYDYPVDIEFTVNLVDPADYAVNIVQCRPLQTRGVGAPVAMPAPGDDDVLFTGVGNFMGGNVRLPVDHVVYVRPDAYLALGPEGHHCVARHVGAVCAALAGSSVMLIGPGRWGTTTSSLGVPVRFAEIRAASVLVEVTYPAGDFRPELSYGSHFFQDLVEAGIFYAALFVERDGVAFHAERLLAAPNRLLDLDPDAHRLADVVHVVSLPGLELYSDVVTQRLVCQ